MNFKYFIRDSLRKILGQTNYINLRFYFTHKYKGNFVDPITWNEKIQNRKLTTSPECYSKFVDKFYVRNYISNTIGSEYLIPLLARFEKITEHDFSTLPSEFVLKTSNGGGGVNVKVVNDKLMLDYIGLTNLFNHAVSDNIGEKIDEPFYDVEDASILVEELLKNSDGSTLLDYKFHVFNNDSDINILLQVNSNYKKKGETKTLYDMSGFKSDVQFLGYDYGPERIVLPENFNHMKELALSLSKPFQYVRVDLYNVDGKIYFGELTFCPASGWDRLNTYANDLKLGSWWGS